jgi:hypothetical protein
MVGPTNGCCWRKADVRMMSGFGIAVFASGILMKQSIPSAALSIIPNASHAINIEEPDEYNRIVGEFLSQVDSGRWPMRDPRAISKSITGIKP